MNSTNTPAAKVIRDLWKRHQEHKKKDSNTSGDYWTEHEAIKAALRDQLTPEVLASVNADALLKVGSMQGRYRFREPHAFVTLLARAHDAREEAREAMEAARAAAQTLKA